MMMWEVIIVSGMWAIVTAVILKDILAVKRAEARVKIAEAERMMAQRDYYRDLMRRKRKEQKESETGSGGSIESILEELGIDLNNPLVRKMIEKYAKKFFEKLGSEGSEEEKIKFVG